MNYFSNHWQVLPLIFLCNCWYFQNAEINRIPDAETRPIMVEVDLSKIQVPSTDISMIDSCCNDNEERRLSLLADAAAFLVVSRNRAAEFLFSKKTPFEVADAQFRFSLPFRNSKLEVIDTSRQSKLSYGHMTIGPEYGMEIKRFTNEKLNTEVLVPYEMVYEGHSVIEELNRMHAKKIAHCRDDRCYFVTKITSHAKNQEDKDLFLVCSGNNMADTNRLVTSGLRRCSIIGVQQAGRYWLKSVLFYIVDRPDLRTLGPPSGSGRVSFEISIDDSMIEQAQTQAQRQKASQNRLRVVSAALEDMLRKPPFAMEVVTSRRHFGDFIEASAPDGRLSPILPNGVREKVTLRLDVVRGEGGYYQIGLNRVDIRLAITLSVRRTNSNLDKMHEDEAFARQYERAIIDHIHQKLSRICPVQAIQQHAGHEIISCEQRGRVSEERELN